MTLYKEKVNIIYRLYKEKDFIMLKTFTKYWMLLTIITMMTLGISQPQAMAAEMVYTTPTGKYYYEDRSDRGLKRAKTILTMTVEQAQQNGKLPHDPQTIAQQAATQPVKPSGAPEATTKRAPKNIQRHGSLVHNDNQYTYRTKAPFSIAATSIGNVSYDGAHILYVNNNAPHFSHAQLSHKKTYAKYYSRDRLGRATGAEALLSAKMMPKATRKPLTFNPTGWNKIHLNNGKYLYDRTHLIGYQLTGQNNNPKNLITATAVLNRSHGMEHYENQVASYLRKDHHNQVYYQVRPIYKGNNRVASGVQMQAKSVNSNAINFNVYIFNVQDGFNINYATGK